VSPGKDSRCCALLRTLGCLALAAVAAAARATPYVPADDAAVLERVPARSALEALRPLRAAVAARPQDLTAALELAQGFIEIGRREGDPRFVAYAQPVLAPWMNGPRPAERALVLGATALQYLHQFDAALALLERALALEPLDGQAWLTRAALLELKGAYPDARRACARLTRTADALLALTCLASVNSRSGTLAASYAALRQVAGGEARLAPPVRSWMLTVLADLAERSGDPDAAEQDLRAALDATPDDPYVRAACADRLLASGRAAAVVTLLQGAEAQDALLLRLAIAGKRAGHAAAARWAALYAERVRAARRDGDLTHRREQALFLLEVADEPGAALEAAAANFRTQREPIDVRLYLQAAQRAHSEADRSALSAWMASVHYEDRTLASAAAPVVAR
jgi:tetratricopeptide (TPR) repeat protein